MDTPPLAIIGAPVTFSQTRRAVRAVVRDEAGRIALLHVANRGYHKLPGGGVEEGEDDTSALERECREEIGCSIEIEQPIGWIREYREDDQCAYDSFCFIARVKGDIGHPSFTEEEISTGLNPVWVSLDEALQLLESDAPDGSTRQSIVRRDIVFLEEFKKMIYNTACILLYDEEGKFLLQHRAEDAVRLPGYWALFGGGIEEGEHPDATVVREAKEELGYDLQNAQYVFTQEIFDEQNRYRGVKHIYVAPFDQSQAITLGEGQGYGWYFLKDAFSLHTVHHDHEVFRRVQEWYDIHVKTL